MRGIGSACESCLPMQCPINGHKRFRSGVWRLSVFAGVDPDTGGGWTSRCFHGGLNGQTPYEPLRQKTKTPRVSTQRQSHS